MALGQQETAYVGPLSASAPLGPAPAPNRAAKNRRAVTT